MALPGWLLSKNITVWCNKALELLIPPVISDRKVVACFLNYLQGRGFRYYDVIKSPVDFPRCNRDSDCTAAQWTAALDLILGKRVLDIGCGRGKFLEKLSRRGFQCVGIDPNQDERMEHNLQILKGRVEEFGFQSGSFDTVLSFKTLEHIPDAKAVLADWKKIAHYRVILILPCQRYRRYVYDGHINFYPDEF